MAAFEEVPEKLLLWGHSFLLSVKLGESIEWQLWPERHVLGLSAVAWGAHTTAKFRKDQGIDRLPATF